MVDSGGCSELEPCDPQEYEPVEADGWERAWKALAAIAALLMVVVLFIAVMTIYRSQSSDRQTIRDLRASQQESLDATTCRARMSTAVTNGLVDQAVAIGDMLKGLAAMPPDRAAVAGAVVESNAATDKLEVARAAQAAWLADPVLPCPLSTGSR